MSKLGNLNYRFDLISISIECVEDEINNCIEQNKDTSKYDRKLEKLETAEYEIQLEIESLGCI